MGTIDITLRHVTRRRPEDLARPFVPARRRLEVIGWVDSQVTKIERRVDKALRLRVAGKPRVLHFEFYVRLHGQVPDTMFEYLGFLFTALRAEATGEPVPLIDSVAVILTGPRTPPPAVGVRRTSWPRRKFSGMHFRIDAVYQRTVAELRARGSVLWLVFAPLARDATGAALREVIADIRRGAADEQEREELLIALIAVAKLDPWGHNLAQEIEMMTLEEQEDERIQQEVFDSIARMPSVARMIARVEARRIAAAKAEKDREEAIAQLLGHLFARRVGRRPTTDEERSLVKRSHAVGPETVEDALLDLDRDALVHWLAEPAT
jgi:hypothetical protein